jgi:predicted short-subunit dehydrogenase-like oxidoreductase (DUF2520 family)
MINRIIVLGSGNVAFHFCKAATIAGVEILQIYSRNLHTASQLAEMTGSVATDKIGEITPDADAYIFAMNDDADVKVASEIIINTDKIMVHTAGSLSMNIFKDKTENYGVFYPFQTFSRNAKLDFTEVPFCLEASNKDTLNQLVRLTERLRCKHYIIDEEQRKVLHLSGVFVCNFMNHSITIGENILKESGIDKSILKSLIKQSFDKVLSQGAYDSQTGPALRKDIETIQKHLDFLENNKLVSEIYTLMSSSISQTYNSKK